MKVVSSAEKMPTVDLSTVSEIPSEAQIVKAISIIHKEKDKQPQNYIYMKFPFGNLCFNKLKELRSYYDQVRYQDKVNEDQLWLKKVKKISSQLPINIHKIEEYLTNNVWNSKQPLASDSKGATIQSFIGDRWLSNYDIDTFFEIVNKNYDDIIGFVYKPSQYIYSFAGANEKVNKAKLNGIPIKKVLVALNVYRTTDGTCLLSQEDNRGNHWSLLVTDIEQSNSYYGDSLSWPLPKNFNKTIISTFDLLSKDLKININKCLENIYHCNNSNSVKTLSKFYPSQTCSNMCGVIEVCMVGVFCELWEEWVTWNGDVQIPLLTNPSINNLQLRSIAMSWILDETIDSGTFSSAVSDSSKFLSNNVCLDKHTCEEN